MEYRLYFLNPADRIRSVNSFEANSDDIAVAIAERKSAGHYFELWNRARLVKRKFDPKIGNEPTNS